MASVNKVILVGGLGADPELKYLASGDPVANLRVATSESWKDKAGVKQDKTEWHRVVVYGKLAEICGEYLKKGSSVYLEGKIQTRKWQNKEGQDQYSTEIIADRMQMLGGKPANSAMSQDSNEQGGQNTGGTPVNKIDDMDDDIPFIVDAGLFDIKE